MTYYFDKVKFIFEKLQIKEPLRTALYNIHNIGQEKFYKIFKTKTNYQHGGNYDKEIIIEYKNHKFLFSRFKDNDYIFYALHQNESTDNSLCIMVIVEKNEYNCAIHSLSYDDYCFKKKIVKHNDKYTGSDLLKLSIKLIDKIKDKYKIKTITLQDNAQKYCGKNKRINLGMMLTLITGDTWYGKYGFVPKEKNNRKLYLENKDIMEKTKMSDIPDLKNMIKTALKKYYSDNKKMRDGIMESYENYLKNNNKIKSYLSYLLNYYDITCEMFYDFYFELYEKMKLHNLHNISYIKKL